MPKKIPQRDPKVRMHLSNAVRDEFFALLSFLRFQWGLALLLVTALATVVYLADPLPPRRVTLGTGQVNTTFDVLGKRYVEYFRRHGVELELRSTSGTLENIALLRQGKLDVGFSLSGATTPEDNERLLSLGSVDQLPLWFFHKSTLESDARSGPASFFKKMAVSINLPASGTYVFAHRILSLHGLTPDDSPDILSLSSKESVDAYLAGTIDGIFLMGTLDSKSITTLLAAPNTQPFNFSLAQAYVKKFPELSIVSVPRGAIDAEVEPTMPASDVQMIAATATLLTDERLHPAIQLLLLKAAKDINQSTPSLFNKPGTFPAPLDRATPLTDIAQRYYDTGPPLLINRAPFWLASLVDRIWIYLVAIAVFGYPLMRLIPNYRSTYVQLCLKASYAELDLIDLRLNQPASDQELAEMLTALDTFELNISKLWVTSSMRAPYYGLRQAVDVVRAKAHSRRQFPLQQAVATQSQ